MAMNRHGLGVMIWASLAYVQAAMPTNTLCSNMAYPGHATGKCLRYMIMSLMANLVGSSWGGLDTFGLERNEDMDVKQPLKSRLACFHVFSDANLTTRSVTGGAAMLARGCVQVISQRQHLASPDAHTSEVVAAGTVLNLCVPLAGLLQEMHVRIGAKVPFYLDSATTVFVGTSDTAIKKSVWLIRRAAVLTDGVTHGLIEPLWISERDMVADPLTKYLPVEVWRRHMHYLQNLEGPVPE